MTHAVHTNAFKSTVTPPFSVVITGDTGAFLDSMDSDTTAIVRTGRHGNSFKNIHKSYVIHVHTPDIQRFCPANI